MTTTTTTTTKSLSINQLGALVFGLSLPLACAGRLHLSEREFAEKEDILLQTLNTAEEVTQPSHSTTNRRVLTYGELKPGSPIQSIFEFKTDRHYLWIQEHVEFLQWKYRPNRASTDAPYTEVWSTNPIPTSSHNNEYVNPEIPSQLQNRLRLPKEGYTINEFVISRTDIKDYLLSMEKEVETIEPSSLHYRAEDGTRLRGVYNESDKYFYFRFSEHCHQQNAQKQKEHLSMMGDGPYDQKDDQDQTPQRKSRENSLTNAPQAYVMSTTQRHHIMNIHNSEKYQVGDFRVRLTGVAEHSNVIILGAQKHGDLLKPFDIITDKLQCRNIFGIVFCQNIEEYPIKRRLVLQDVFKEKVSKPRDKTRLMMYGGMVGGFFVLLHVYGQSIDETTSTTDSSAGLQLWINRMLNVPAIFGRWTGTEKISRSASEFGVSLLFSLALFGMATATGKFLAQNKTLIWKKDIVDIRQSRLYSMVVESDDSEESDAADTEDT